MFGNIKVLQVGCGKMAKYIMRYVFEKGGSVVAGIDIDSNLFNKDIGEVMGTAPRGALIYPVEKLAKVIESTRPDIAVVATMSLLNDIKDVVKILVSNGVSVITTCEEAFYAINSNPKVYDELHEIAVLNNCTITGSGYQDTFWGSLITSIAGSTHKITQIKGSSSYNVEDYGIALAAAHGAGLTMEEFNTKIASIDNISFEQRKELIDSGKFLPSYTWNTVGWIADKMKLKIHTIEQKCIPIVADQNIHSATLQIDIAAGMVRGMSAVVTATTEEGIIIEAECVGKVYAPDEVDENTWVIKGEPETTMTIKKPATVELTCANVVNRIPDVLNAIPGFVPTCYISDPMYKSKSLKEYIKPKK